MRRTACSLWPLLALLPLLLLGCDSSPNDDERVGYFQAHLQGDVTTEVEGSAQFLLETDDSGAPSHFEIMLFAENRSSSDIIIQNARGSGAPQDTVYTVHQTLTGASPLDVRAEFILDRFDTSAPRYDGERGQVVITRVTETTLEGQFNFDAVNTSGGGRVMIDGRFTAQQP